MAKAARATSEETQTIDPFEPRRNPHLEGHDEAEATVLDAWNSGRFPHAWLLCGAEGIGKATFAYRLARFILANGGAEDGGGEGGSNLFGDALAADGLAISGESQTARLVASAGHPDMRVLTRGMMDAAGKPTATIINVFQTRRVVDFTYQTSAISPWRVVIVDPADDFNTSSANAILKALEEPPPRAAFLLISHSPGGLLPTIRSRCRKLQFKALDDDRVASLVRRYRPETPEEEARTLARIAEGSVGRALAYQAAGGLGLFGDLTALLSRPREPDIGHVSRLADRVAGKGREAAYDALGDLMDWWFKRLVRGIATGEGPAPIDTADAQAIAAFRDLGGGPGPVLTIRDRAVELLGQAHPPANLDRRQITFALFTEMQRLSRGGA
ncbi:DNA polymerase III subunit delta' [Marivibrio halodurans]|uniref:DNA polymerase III subunit delta n=1 Tax=Marivibrio halodurans TaxID=2039722 RepID=A0A8J7RWC1_9PROT|nr:DNA polymerase III subunit delta' [Marivibrio halodurans]MBP5855595.1 DNA polymerase III subunit delta' [Marivibrio halodurans]